MVIAVKRCGATRVLVKAWVNDTLVVSLHILLDETSAALLLVVSMERAVVSVYTEGTTTICAISGNI